jgi:hypothetical protein
MSNNLEDIITTKINISNLNYHWFFISNSNDKILIMKGGSSTKKDQAAASKDADIIINSLLELCPNIKLETRTHNVRPYPIIELSPTLQELTLLKLKFF